MELGAPPRRRRRRCAGTVGGLAPRRARRRRAGAGQGPDRRRRVGHRRRDRAQLLPLGRDHRDRAAVGGDVRGRARALRLSPGRLRRRGARAPGRTTWSRSASSTSAPATSRSWSPAPRTAASTSTWRWPDWEAPVEALLHERRGGWADAMQTVRHLAERARERPAPRSREGVEVTGFELTDGGVEAIETSEGRVDCETRRGRAGPVDRADLGAARPDPVVELAGERRPLVTYLKAQEGEFALAGRGAQRPAGARGAGGAPRPGGPAALGSRRARARGRARGASTSAWGRTGTGITGGGLPVLLDDPELDPYGPDNPEHAAEPAFEEFFASGLATALRRFRGRGGDWRMTAGRRPRSPTRPTTTRSATGCAPASTRSSTPATASRRSRSAASWPTTWTAASRCSSRSGSAASHGGDPRRLRGPVPLDLALRGSRHPRGRLAVARDLGQPVLGLEVPEALVEATRPGRRPARASRSSARR